MRNELLHRMNRLKLCKKWDRPTTSFPLKSEHFFYPLIQLQIWNCFVCTASSKFCKPRLLVTELICVKSFFVSTGWSQYIWYKCTKHQFLHLLTATLKNSHIENSKNHKRWYCLHHPDCVSVWFSRFRLPIWMFNYRSLCSRFFNN